MKTRTFGLVLVVLLAAGVASAQSTGGRGPAGEGGAGVSIADPGAIERVLNALERRGLLPNAPDARDGLTLRVDSFDDGNRLAIGPLWRDSRLAGRQVELFASAAVSLRNDREVVGGVQWPRLSRNRLHLALTASATELPHSYFYGLGGESRRSDRNVFELGRRTVRSAVTFAPTRRLTIEAGTGLLSAQLRTLGGLDIAGADHDFLHSRIAVTFDDRDRRTLPRRGGRYQLSLERFAGPEQEWTSFNRVNTALEQHIAVGKTPQTVSLRLIGSLSRADEGHDVPFYLMPTLGGSNLLRGFGHERFRDRHYVVMQGEYGWDLSRNVGAVFFYERGAVARRLSGFSFSHMRSDYGIGFRIGSPRAVALRTDVAFGSGEGTRVALRFHSGW